MIIKDKVALVTGGVSGLGLSFARALLSHGLKGVCLADINVTAGQDVIQTFQKEFGPNKAIFIKTDVTNKIEFEEAFKKTVKTFKGVNILINCAGAFNERNFTEVIDTNLNAVLLGTQLAMDNYLPKYKTSMNDSVVINISSTYGLEGCPIATAYAASKYGVIGIAKSLGTERHYQKTGVKILTLCPGFTDTPLLVNVEDKLLPGRYTELYEDACSTSVSIQKPEVVAKALVKILKNFETGSVWIIENDECFEVEIPTRTALRKKTVL